MNAPDNGLDFVAATVKEIRASLKAANDTANFRLAELAQNLEDNGSAAAIDALTKAVSELRLPEVRVEAPPIPQELIDLLRIVSKQKAPVFNTPELKPSFEMTVPAQIIPPELMAALSRIAEAMTPKPAWNTLEVRIPQPYGAERVMTIKRTS